MASSRPSAVIAGRLLALVVGSMAVLLAVQATMFNSIITGTIVEHHLDEYRALARSVEMRGPSTAREALVLTTSAPRVLLTGVLDEDDPLAVEDAVGDRALLANPMLRDLLRSGEVTGELDLGDRLGFAYVIPMDDGRRLLLVEEDMAATIASSIGGRMRPVIAAALLAILPLGWWLGGRRVVAAAVHLEEQVTRDGLTDLRSHRAFLGALPTAVEAALSAGGDLALLVLDLDRFGAFDQQHGHVAADAVLVATARAIEDLAPRDAAFRISGDQFAMLLPLDRDGAMAVGERLRRSRELDGPVTVSVGVACLDDGDGDGEVDSLHVAATAALAHAKRSGRNRVLCHDEIASRTLLPTQRRRAALRRIIEEQSIDVAWQPVVRRDGTLVGFEALSRPVTDEPALRLPAAAFELADLTGATVELDAACTRSILEHARDGLGDDWLFVNVSPLSLVGGSLAPDRFAAELVASGLRTTQVVVEITEREIVDPRQLAGPVAALRAAGIRVALDDVGAGNAGLGVMRSIPLDVVKFDRRLVVDAAAGDVRAAAVVIALHTLARDLGVEIVAEGVETPEQIELGGRIGTMLQGYGIARPAPSPAAARDAVASWRASLTT